VTGGPPAELLAVAMIGVACFHAGRLILAVRWRRPTEADVDVVHAAMGVSMAGMLTGWLTGAWNDVWTVAFAASTVWFGRKLVRRVEGSRPGGPLVSHHLPHFVASGVMLSMLWAMRWAGVPAGQPGSSGGGGTMAHMTGGGVLLAYILAALVVANAAVAAWATLPASPPAAPAAVTGSPPGPARLVGMLGSRGAPVCFVVMGVAMAYMVVSAHL
jgi:hypothetical protein